MPMDRSELMNVINAGRSSAFNVYEIGRKIVPDDPIGPLFRNKTLNDALFFKIMERDSSHYNTISTVQTLVYFPYNLRNIYEGGDSVLFDDPAFHRVLRLKTGVDAKGETYRADHVMDLEILEMIHGLPTLDPFLLRSKAEQLDLHGRIHPFYFNISEEEWKRIRAPIRTKIRTLVRRAYTSESGRVSAEKVEQHVTRFLAKIWEAKDVEGIEDFVRSLEISADRAPDLFFAWKAICYYQVQFEDFLPRLRHFYAWLGSDGLAVPTDWGRLMREDRERIEYTLLALRDRIRATYQAIRRVIGAYEESCRDFIENNRPRTFKDFLSRADDDYVDIATCISANVHGARIWELMVERHGERLRYEQFNELIDTLSILFDLRQHAPGMRAAE